MTETQRIVTFPLQLRKETETAHNALETLPISRQLMSPFLTLEEYASYLTMMFSVVLQAEKSVFPLVRHVVNDIEERRMLPLITEDLRNLDRTPPYPADVFGGGPFSVPFAMGIMYVIEGSALGGRVILKNVQKQIAVTESRGGRYFAGYGNQTASKWKSFLAILSEYEARTGSGAEIIDGANFAFMRIQEHLKKSTSV